VIIEVSPDDASTDVSRDTTATVLFSEPLDADRGTVRVRANGEALDADVAIAASGVSIAPADLWPASTEIEIRLDADFADEAGNTLERGAVFRFTTRDDGPPRIVSTDPAEGATDVPARIGAIRIRFDEPMDQAAGTATLEGGPGALGAAAWSPFEVSYAVSGLANDTAYRVVLAGFLDRQGNAFDATLLGDSAIDFETRADDEAPRIVSSLPFEGQVDVLIDAIGGTVTVELDEAMDTSIVAAPLTVAGETSDVSIAWIDDRHAEIDVIGVARTDAVHSLDLRGLRDLAGNALAIGPPLGDGRLDFTAGVDAFVPYVAASTPDEGATGVAIPLARVEIAFSEAMDTTVTDVTIADDLLRSAVLTGTWRSGGTVLELDGDAFTPGRTYAVDLTAMRDSGGTALSSAHPYLGDGVLDFSLAAPTGASCDVPILAEHAESVVMGRYHFAIPTEQRTRNNRSASCDPDGPSDTDAVILYRKATPRLGEEGGRALRVTAESDFNRTNVEVFQDHCEPRAPGADAARRTCLTGHNVFDQFLDVPAGDYYVWVSTADGSHADLDAWIEEVDTIPEGEACGDPYDTTSASYVAPGVPGEPHVWNLSSVPNNSFDIATTNGPFQGFSCREEPFGDVVIAYDKTSADSVLDVRVTSGGFGSTVEIVTGTCRADAGGTRAGCIPSVTSSSPRRLTANAPAGPVYVWLAATSSSQTYPGGRVEIRELPARQRPARAARPRSRSQPARACRSRPITPRATSARAASASTRT
jgi:hypothetical protein